MKKISEFLITVICILSVMYAQYPSSAAAAPAGQTGEAKEVVAKGFGAILAGDEVKAKEDAVASALRNAVEQVVGTMIESQTLVENYQMVEDKIYSRTAGYVQRYDVISTTKQSDSSLEVTVRAVVKLTDLRNDLEAINVLIQRKGKPRTMVLIEEQNLSYNYHFTVDMNSTETALMNEMMNYGFPFVDATQTRQAIARDVAMAALQGDAAAAAQIALRAGAEIIITGKAIGKVTQGTASMRNAGMVSGQANVNFRVIRADDAGIVAVASAHAAKAHIDELTATSEALAEATKTAAVQLKDKIVQAWQKDVYSSSQVQLQVMNISSFGQLNTFKNSLQYYVRGVQAVHQRSFAGGTALFDVDIKGSAASMAGELDAKEIEGLKLKVIEQTANKVTVSIVQ
jgi:hypothetical protein